MLARSLFNKITITPKTLTALRYFYDLNTKNDTIYAPATTINPAKGSPLSVIRVSGRKTEIVLRQFTGRNVSRIQTSPPMGAGCSQDSIAPRAASLVKIQEPNTRNLIDLALVLWFPQPRSYTGEDVCEFHLHGSHAIMQVMLDLLGSMDGLRPAEPGEFTRRALSNGKMSLIEAESLPDLIASKTDTQRKLALRGLNGSVRERYEGWIDELMNILAHLEASIDFGEDELIGEREVVEACIKRLFNLSNEIWSFTQNGERSRQLIQDGFKIAILGKPNAGKSTLMNLLCQRKKSIVSDLSGTTRDVVEHSFELGGHLVTLSDTAGLRDLKSMMSGQKPGELLSKSILDKHDRIECEGIGKAMEVAAQADVILYLVDAELLTDGHTVAQELEELSTYLPIDKKVKIHLLLNKIDLIDNSAHINYMFASLKTLLKTIKSNSICDITLNMISCSTEKNFAQFADQLRLELDLLSSRQSGSEDDFSVNKPPGTYEPEYVNERHLSLLKSTYKHLQRASQLDLDTIDEMAQHARESLDYLSRIVGTVSNEEIIDIIFRDFCIGK